MGYIGNKPTAVPLTSADIQDGVITAADLGANSVDSSELVDNSVTLAKMAGLARGKLIYGDASGDPAALAVGGADEVLTHDGTDFDWAAAGGFDVSSITGATELATIPDNTDELVLSDGGTLKRIDYSNLVPFGSLGGSFYQGIQSDLTNSTWNKITLDTTVYNRGLTFGSSTITIPAGGDGDYFLSAYVSFHSYTYAGIANASMAIYLNGAIFNNGCVALVNGNTQSASDEYNSRQYQLEWSGVLKELNATDTLELYVNVIMDGSVASGNRQAEYNSITLFRINDN